MANVLVTGGRGSSDRTWCRPWSSAGIPCGCWTRSWSRFTAATPRRCRRMPGKLRPVAQLELRDWEMRCPTCGAQMSPVPTSEEKPLDPSSVYAISKQDQEQLCLVVGRAYGIPTVALRYFNVYGAGQALSNPYTGICAIFSSRLLNDQAPIVFEDGEQTRDFVHVSDIVQANLRAMESDQGDYEMLNIGTGVPTSVNQVAKMLSDGLGKKIPAQIVGKFREGD